MCEGAADAMAAVRAGDGRRDRQADLRLDGARAGARERSRRRLPRRAVARAGAAVFYVQRAVDHGGRDVRVFVVGGAVLGAIERRAPEGEWRTNVSRGGSARPFDAAAGVGRLRCAPRRRSAPTMPASICCPRATGRVFVLEVNGIPGMAGAAARHGARRRRRDRGSPRAIRVSARRPVAEFRSWPTMRLRRDGRSLSGTADVTRQASPRRSWRASSRRAPRSRATSRRGAISPTRATRTSSPARPRLASRWPAPARVRSARRCASPSRRRRAGPARTRISASSSCWRRSRARGGKLSTAK